MSITGCSYLDPEKSTESYEISQRIKARCGIPDSVMWSDKMRLVYGKQIEAEIRSINKKQKR